MSNPHKIRDHIGNPGVAQNRNEIYKSAISKFNKAMDLGFYFEAVAIMESRIGELSNQDVPFNTLGNLRDRLNGNRGHNQLETNNQLVSLYNRIVNQWASKRNKALHQIVKISKVGTKDWDDFVSDAKIAAEEGRQIFLELNKLLKRERR